MPRKYKITLTPEERRCLERMVRSGKTPARTLTRARVLPKADRSEGRAARSDFEYVRRGVTSLSMFFEPSAARRQAMARGRRGARQWAEVMRGLVDVHDPEAGRIVPVLGNLNIGEVLPALERVRI